MARIKVIDKEFETSIPENKILEAIDAVALKMNQQLEGKNPLFVCVLNGAFMFASDLMKRINIPCEITFVKVASYSGTETSGNLKRLIGFNENVENRTVVILEDIVDTGNTIVKLIEEVKTMNPAEVQVATLLFKPEACKQCISLDYVGLEIPNDFIIGYGLDYNGQGRNLKDIYTLAQ